MNGTLEQTAAGPRLRFTRRLAHPPEKVWRALTEPEHLRAWFPDEFHAAEWRVGAALDFGGFDGEVLEYAPPTLLAFRWGTDELRFELAPDGAGTRLTLLDTLDALGKAARDGAGWHACLDALASHLDGTPAVRHADRWREVHPSYVRDLGPQAATIGPPEGALD